MRGFLGLALALACMFLMNLRNTSSGHFVWLGGVLKGSVVGTGWCLVATLTFFGKSGIGAGTL